MVDPAWYIMGGFFGLVVLGLAVGFYLERRRRDQLRELAGRLHLEFQEKPSDDLRRLVGGLRLFGLGRQTVFRNIIDGRTADVRTAMFDYQYIVGSGKQSSSHNQTVVLFSSPLLKLPSFVMRPENLLDRVGSMVGFEDIDFADHPEFSKRFHLSGPAPQAVREFFTPELLRFFEAQDPGYTVEGAGQSMIVYRRSRRIRPSAALAFFEQAFEVYGALRSE